MDLTPFPADTSPEAAWVQIEVFRRMAPSKRLRMTLELGDSVRAITAAGVRNRHPEFTDEQVKLATIRLTLGEKLFREAYGDVALELEKLLAAAERAQPPDPAV